MTFPDFNSKFEKIRYGVFMALFPSIVIIAFVGMYMNIMNAEHDFDRTELMISIYNNTHIGIENLMIENCEQDAQINAILGYSVDEVTEELTDCLNAIPFMERPDSIKVGVSNGDGDDKT